MKDLICRILNKDLIKRLISGSEKLAKGLNGDFCRAVEKIFKRVLNAGVFFKGAEKCGSFFKSKNEQMYGFASGFSDCEGKAVGKGIKGDCKNRQAPQLFAGTFDPESSNVFCGKHVKYVGRADFIQLFADGGGDSVGEGDSDGVDDGRCDEEFSKLIKGKYRDAYAKRTQNIINRRFRETKELEEFRGRFSSLSDRLFEKYGVEKGNFDSLENALFGISEVSGGEDAIRCEKTACAENGAAENDSLPDVVNSINATAENENDSEGDENAKASAEKVRGKILDARRRAIAEKIYCSWLEEAEKLSEYYPGFDLGKECAGPAFAALLSAGVSMRDAYEAVHHREILSGAMRYTAKKVSDDLWRSVLSGSARPSENGLSSRGASFEKKRADRLTDGDIRNILRRVEKGEKVRF